MRLESDPACWNIYGSINVKMYYSIMRAQDLSIYRRAVRTKDGRLPPETVLGDSVMSGRHLRSVMSGRHLRSVISGRPLF